MDLFEYQGKQYFARYDIPVSAGGPADTVDEAVTEAREILAAMEAAKANGEGATVYKGRLVDIASIKQAEVIVRQSEMIAR